VTPALMGNRHSGTIPKVRQKLDLACSTISCGPQNMRHACVHLYWACRAETIVWNNLGQPEHPGLWLSTCEFQRGSRPARVIVLLDHLFEPDTLSTSEGLKAIHNH
jgi:hypothetical protein